MPDSFIHDVVIAGAGPVGLFLACELRLAGLSVLVLERAAHPDSPLKMAPFGMRGLSAPTLDAFHRRGLLEEVMAPSAQDGPADGAGARATATSLGRRPGGHFAGIAFFEDDVDSAWPYRVPGPLPTHLATSMGRIESVLAARAVAMGVDIRRGLAVDSVDRSGEIVSVSAGGAIFRGRWLVGCDGGRSVVRKAGGFAFTGTEPEFTGYSVQVDMADPDRLVAGRHYTATGMYTYQKPGIVAMVDFDGGARHRAGPLSLEPVQAVLRHISGTDVTLTELKLAATWTDRAHQATAYRHGRVLLAGDAAHIHSPLGGQGLNLGLGDAINLGWKLAATIRGDAPDGLLDSYHAERHPVGAQVLDWSRAQVALMRPHRGARALEAILRDLIVTRDGASYFAERLRGVSLRYDLGDAHPLVGRAAPDFALADGTRLGDHFRTGQGVLLDFTADSALRALAARWRGRIAYLAGAAPDTLGVSAVLARPDGVVAWAGEAAPDHDGATRAAYRWFGAP